VLVKGLLEALVVRGVKLGRKRLFVTDSSKALRAAIDAMYGEDNPLQRCRGQKRRNVLGVSPQRAAGTGRGGDAGSLATGVGGGDGPSPNANGVVGAVSPEGRGEYAGRLGGDLHHPPAGARAVSAQVPGDDRSH
jgi:hypothetical protein